MPQHIPLMSKALDDETSGKWRVTPPKGPSTGGMKSKLRAAEYRHELRRQYDDCQWRR